MTIQLNLIAIGALAGLSYFVYETTTIGNVYFRPDTDGNIIFAPLSVIELLTFPFHPVKASTAWGVYPDIPLSTRWSMLRINWVAMLLLGAAIGFGIEKIVENST